jgi:hypothetical protein
MITPPTAAASAAADALPLMNGGITGSSPISSQLRGTTA